MLWFNIIYANITQTFIRKLGLLGQIYWRRFYLAFRVNLIFIFYPYCEKSKFEVSKTPSRLSWKVFPIFVFLVDITHNSPVENIIDIVRSQVTFWLWVHLNMTDLHLPVSKPLLHPAKSRTFVIPLYIIINYRYLIFNLLWKPVWTHLMLE